MLKHLVWDEFEPHACPHLRVWGLFYENAAERKWNYLKVLKMFYRNVKVRIWP